MCAIDAIIIKWSEAQLRSRWFGTAAPPTPSAPFTSAPFSSTGGVTLDAIMAQLQCMDAHLDTLNDELCQVNTRIDRIARQQARFGGFVESPSPPPEASEDDKASKDDNDSDDDDDDKDGDASCSSADKMST